MFGRKKDTKEAIYKTLIDAFRSENYQYEKNDEKSLVLISFSGDDLPINMAISVNESHIGISCYLPFKAPEGAFKDVVWKLNEINQSLSFGAFSIDPSDGIIQFRYGYIFTDADPSRELILSIVSMIVQTVDEHDGALQKIAPEYKSDFPSYIYG